MSKYINEEPIFRNQKLVWTTEVHTKGKISVGVVYVMNEQS